MQHIKEMSKVVFLTFSLLLSSALCIEQDTETGSELCQIPVTKHYLTLKPPAEYVEVMNGACLTVPNQQNYLNCSGELSGSYTWEQENDETNYVLFEFSQKVFVSEINMTYVLTSQSETPKVTFCLLPQSFSITDSFNGLECEEMNIRAASTAQTVSLMSPFVNGTSKVAMEVITQGIKTALMTKTVQFYRYSCLADVENTPQFTSPLEVTTASTTSNNTAEEEKIVGSGEITSQAIAMTMLMITALMYFIIVL